MRVDCCIAGCGPAGAMLGLLLARAGLRVTVLEKHADFLRDFRGDTVHPTTLEIIDELGLAPGFFALPQTHVTRGEIHLPGGRVVTLDLSRLGGRFPFVAFVPQWDFLAFLTREARRYAGFRLELNAEVTDLLEHEGTIEGVRFRDAAGAVREQRAKLTVAADGRGSVVRELAGLPLETQGSALDVLWFRVPRDGSEPEQLGLRVGAGRIVVFFPRGDFWQAGCVIPKGQAEAVRARGLERFLASVAALAPRLEPALRTVKSFDEVKLLSVRSDRLERWWRPGLLAIGDAAHAMSPVGGVGINLAIQDAVAAANVLWRPLREGAVSPGDLARVQRQRLKRTRLVQRMQHTLESLLLERAVEARGAFELPFAARLLLALPKVRELPVRVMMRGLGHPHVETPLAA